MPERWDHKVSRSCRGAGVPACGFRRKLRPPVGAAAGDQGHQVLALHAGELPGPAHQGLGVQVQRGDEAPHGPGLPQALGDGPGVEALHPQLARGLEVIGQPALGPPVGRVGVVLLDDEALHLHPPGFDILGINAVVADQGIGHGDDLALIRGVGEDLLIAGHGGVEHHLAGGFAFAGEGPPLKHQAVFQRQ